MKSNNEILKDLNELEINSGLYEVKVKGVSLWRLVRFKYRVEYLSSENGFTNKTIKSKINIFEILRYFFKSFYQYIKLVISKKKINNLVFAFPRTSKYGDEYIDKFTDPIINQTELQNSSLIIQHSFGRSHNEPRANTDRIFYADFIDVFSNILSKLFRGYVLKSNKSSIDELYNKIQEIYPDSKLNTIKIAESLALFLFYNRLYKPIFKIKRPKNVFIVSREVFKFALFAAHDVKAKVFEIQHGITNSETLMYSGPYEESLDPNYFLAFGEAWINPYYGISEDRIINIGWAYKNFVEMKLVNVKPNCDDVFLVISSPAITQHIINFLEVAACAYPKYKFELRLHPQEELSIEQIEIIATYQNIYIANNKEDSAFAIARHSCVIGDNSSALYEALSMGKRVGKLNMCDFSSRIFLEQNNQGFYVIRNIQDLECMIKDESKGLNEFYYSSFKKEIFNKLIK